MMDNASIHHNLDNQTLEDWVLLYKFVRWRSFKTWAKEKLLEEVKELLEGYGRKFHGSSNDYLDLLISIIFLQNIESEESTELKNSRVRANEFTLFAANLAAN